MSGNQAAFYANNARAIDGAAVRAWFEDPVAVRHYARASASLGLWRSEELVLRGAFRCEQRILDLGCGAGRIALGLWKLGFRNLIGVDFCQPMIEEARRLAEAAGCAIEFQQGDALDLAAMADESIDGVVFGFNGLMQIPARENRRRALREMKRVTAPGGRVVFTTHDRDLATQRNAWVEEAARWRGDARPAGLVDFGDRVFASDEGTIFMHLPDRAEILEDLAATGWTHLEDHLRSVIANETFAVREFAEECRFWLAQRPDETKTAR